MVSMQTSWEALPEPSPAGMELELARVEGGRFWMGSSETSEESPRHEVDVPRFWMGRSPVTNSEYARFIAENCREPVPKFWSDPRRNDPRFPVVGVSWEEARRFASWAGGRLPSEAEWEFVSRISEGMRGACGVHELFGKVMQWVEDDWHGSFLAAPDDGSAWVEHPRNALRVVRGTAWFHAPILSRATFRSWDQPLARDDFIGFRIARSGL